VHFVPQAEKSKLLIKLLGEHKGELTLVFGRTKHGAERLMKQINKAGIEAASIHGNKSQGQRDRAIAAFKKGEVSVLVATDVAARGIDIPGVAYVYNFDLPNVAENYVHRIGRTARAGTAGRAIAFCSPEEMAELWAIQKVAKLDIPVLSGEPVLSDGPPPKKGQRPHGRGKPGGGSGGGAGAGSGSGKPSGQRRRRRRGPAKKAA